MKNFYGIVVQELKNFSQTYDRTTLLINKPWALVDGDQEIQKLIFKKDKELVISKNGNVTMGSWEYLPEAKSLLINRGVDTILCNEGFIDEAVLVLKKDGTSNDFFVLANENIITDLDAIKYLRSLRSRILRISYGYLKDGRLFEIHKKSYDGFDIGDSVTIDYEPAADGIYSITDSSKKFFVEKNKIAKVIRLAKYQTISGKELIIEHLDHFDMRKGDPVYIDNQPAPDGKYKLKGRKIIVEQGTIKKMPWF